MSTDIDQHTGPDSVGDADRDALRVERLHQIRQERTRKGRRMQARSAREDSADQKARANSRSFRSLVLTIGAILLVFILAFSATFYARSRGWFKGKAPADPTVIKQLFKAL